MPTNKHQSSTIKAWPRSTARRPALLPALGAVLITLCSLPVASDDEQADSNLRIERVELRITNDGGHRIVVAADTELRIEARLTARGAGMLRADWEVSGPAPDPTFRTLKRVRRIVPASGELVLDSPLLPTDVTGRYQVRFRLHNGWQRSAGLGYAVMEDDAE